MYDEDLVEDSLAFAREIKAFLDKKASASQTSETAQPDSSTTPFYEPVSEAEQTIHSHLAQQPADSPNARPRQQASSGAITYPSTQSAQGQSVSPSQAASRPAIQSAQGQSVSPSQAASRPAIQSAQGQPVSPSQAASRPAIQSAQGQPVSPSQAASRLVNQSAQGQQVSPSQVASHLAAQSVQGQPVSSAQSRAAHFTQEQPVPPASRPVEQPVQEQSMPIAQAASHPVTQSVQRQPMPTAQAFSRPAVQPAQGQPMPTVQVVSHPVAQSTQSQLTSSAQAVENLALQSAQSQPTSSAQAVENLALQSAQGRPVASPVMQTSIEPLTERQSVTSANKAQSQVAQSSQPAPGQVEQISSKPESSQSYQMEESVQPVQNQVSPQTTASSEIAAGVEVMDEGFKKKKNHTYEITIKFDLENIKKKFGRLKEKLAPETRTLEEINAAMEENQQLMEEGAPEGEGLPTGDGSSTAGKAGGIAGKLPKLLKRKEAAGQLTEDGNAMDAEIVSLEDGEGGMFGTRLEEAKESISRKASSASRVVTNVIIFVFCIGIAYFFAKFVTTYVAHQTTVEGESMEPTLSDGDNVIIQMVTYYFKDPQRYDVVVFPITNSDLVNQRTYYIKRVIGLPGETVQIIDGSVYINGTQLKDDKYALSDILEPGVASDPLELGEDQYFVMGDNRNMSTDSRNSYVGLVNRDDIVGEAAVCIWPFSHFGSLKK